MQHRATFAQHCAPNSQLPINTHASTISQRASTISHPYNDNFITCNDKFTKGFSYKVSKTKQLKKIFLQKTTKKEHFLAQIMLKNKKITAIKQK